ncbi:MBL fold metallo-hydrolase [Saccharopolyspora sp. NPDC002376]
MCGVTRRSTATPFRASPTDLGFDTVTLRSDVHVLQARSTFWPAPGNILVVEDDQGVALFDCGFGTEEARDGLAAALETLGYELDAVHTVVVTHPHLDHAGGIALLPGHVQVLGPSRVGSLVADASAAAELIFPAAVREIAPERADLDIVEHFRTDCGVAPTPVPTTPVEAGDVISLGRTRWVAVSTPGHESGMFSYFEQQLGILVCSDILASRGTAIPWYAPGGGGTAAYLRGLSRLSELEITLGVRGHGDVIYGAAPVSQAVTATASRITRRTEAVREALSARPLTFAQLEQQIYAERVYEVIPWAASVLATHLLEGLEDGTLRREEDLFAATAGTEVRV